MLSKSDSLSVSISAASTESLEVDNSSNFLIILSTCKTIEEIAELPSSVVNDRNFDLVLF